MKKITSIYICFIIIFYGCNNVVDILSNNNKDSNNDLYDYNIHGQVKELQEIRFNTERLFGDIEKKDTISIYIKKFNREGYITQSSYETFPQYKSDTYSFSMYRNKYSDDNGILESRKGYDNEGKITSHIIYDNDGDNITKDYRLENGDTILISDYIYNQEGQEIERNRYDDRDSKYINYKTKSKYNSKGELIDRSEYNRDGKLRVKYTVAWDNKGNVIESQRKYYDDNDEISMSHIVIKKYDKLDNEIYYKSIYGYEYRSGFKQDTSEFFTSYNYEKDNWITRETKTIYDFASEGDTSVHISERVIIYY